MNKFTKQRGQVLVILLVTLFLGGSSLALGLVATGKSLKDIEKGIKVNVQDASRQKQSLALIEQWKTEGKTLKKEFKKRRKTLLEEIKKHDTDRKAFTSTIDEILNLDQKTSKRLLDIQYSLRQNMTAEEWDKVF